MSHYRAPGSLWSSITPIIWGSTSGSQPDPKGGSRADLGAAPSSSSPRSLRERQIRKLTFGHCLEATPLGSAFGQVTEPLTFTMKIMTCSCAKSSGGYRGERDTSGDTRRYLEDRVCTQRFDSSGKKKQKKNKVCVTRHKRLGTVSVYMPVGVFACLDLQQRLRWCWKEIGVRLKVQRGVIWSCQNFVLRHSIRIFSKHRKKKYTANRHQSELLR